jgi:serine phosphatase RsbU (regulator of sigma subunit)
MQDNKILIVDDESFNLDLLEFSLVELSDIQTIRAENGYEALQIVGERSIDLIILDISMPQMDGLQVLNHLKADEELKYIPVIVVTAQNEERYKALEMGAEDFLSKPIDVIELRLKVNNLLKLKKYNDLQRFFNERLEEEIAKKERQLTRFAKMQQELSLAREIQQSLLPKEFPHYSDLEVFGKCEQASEVGGDYFDIFETECGNYTVIVMADVSGHGFASALIAMQFRTLVHTELMNSSHSLSESVERINTIFSNDNHDSSMFITALFLRFDHRRRVMESVNAGHYDPIGHPTMKHIRGIPLGIQAGMPYHALETPFGSDSSILLYTDGIIEGENADGEMFGDRIYKIFEETNHLDAKSQVTAITQAFNGFIDEEQMDDVTLLILKGKGSEA